MKTLITALPFLVVLSALVYLEYKYPTDPQAEYDAQIEATHEYDIHKREIEFRNELNGYCTPEENEEF